MVMLAACKYFDVPDTEKGLLIGMLIMSVG